MESSPPEVLGLGLAHPASAEVRASPDCPNNGFQTVVKAHR